MASRMVHYLVAKEILKQIDIKDKNAFLIGSIIPDSYNREKYTREETHFVVNYYHDKFRVFDFKKFYEKYLKDEIDDFCLGYFLHLYMDAVYIKEVFSDLVFKSNRDRAELISEAYNDMHMYNTYLRDKYQLKYEIKPLESWKVTELNIEDQEAFFEEFKKDFHDIPMTKMKLYNHKILSDYIENIKILGLKNIKLILDGYECEDSKNYLISNELILKN